MPENSVRAAVENPALSTNYHTLLRAAQRALEKKEWKEAQPPLLRLVELYPGQTGNNSAYPLLALTHRQLQETNRERPLLERWTAQDAEAVDGFQRLMELAAAEGNWSQVHTNARRYLAVDPLQPAPWRHFARAAEALDLPDDAIEGYRAQLTLETPEAARIHFRLATLLAPRDATAARRHVLQALEEAPRYREAHQLLQKLAQADAAIPPGKGSKP